MAHIIYAKMNHFASFFLSLVISVISCMFFSLFQLHSFIHSFRSDALVFIATDGDKKQTTTMMFKTWKYLTVIYSIYDVALFYFFGYYSINIKTYSKHTKIDKRSGWSGRNLNIMENYLKWNRNCDYRRLSSYI